MAENREAILADFQECTGIEDVGEAIFHLEEVNWDLLKAVNRVMPHDTQTLPSEMDVDVEMIEEISRVADPDVSVIPDSVRDSAGPLRVAGRISADVIPIPSTSQAHSSSAQILNFNFVTRDNIVYLQLPDTLTIAELKILLSDRLQIPPCHQEIQGWTNAPKSDRVTLASLKLPKENTLSIVTPDIIIDQEYMSAESNITERLSQYFTLNITDQTNVKTYILKFLGSKTVLEVKADVYALTDIAVRHQVWTGWPEQLKSDKTTLACSGVSPVHDLAVKRNPVALVPSKERKILVDLADSDNSSVEEFEDASETFTAEDDIFVDVETKRMQSLIPDNTEDEASGCIHFAEEFANRYGHSHPDFFLGTLEDAIREACAKPAKDRRLLAVYLHHDASVLTNVFCTQLLCFESVLQCLASNFVVWGWDLTHESNKARFLVTVARTLGTMAAMTIRNIDVERLPAVLVIMKIRSATEIFTVVHGNVGVSELLTSLIQSVDVFSEQQRLEVREEDERSARELVKREQDEAYEESLETDRLKEEAKKHQTMMANKERERKESHRQEMDSIKEANRLEVEASLPSEPEEGAAGDGISKIRFRLPKGDFLTRRFHANTSLQILLNYLIVQGFPPDEFKVISSWPRRDLTSLDPSLTLQELKLYPQETVTLEER